jgi:hypothetical protein
MESIRSEIGESISHLSDCTYEYNAPIPVGLMADGPKI